VGEQEKIAAAITIDVYSAARSLESIAGKFPESLFMKKERLRIWFALWVLFVINTLNFYDRQILGAVGETVRDEWKLSDTALGSLGTAFTLLYAVVGVPLGRMTDRVSRRWILCVGVTVWSVLTAASGLARNFTELFFVRLGGSGEAACAPASASLIGDLFPASGRARAISVFMIGLPLGIALSFLGSSLLEHRLGWRFTFYIAAIPGLICAVLALIIREPARGGAETHNLTAVAAEGSPSPGVVDSDVVDYRVGRLAQFQYVRDWSFPFAVPPTGSSLEQVECRDDLDGGIWPGRHPRTDCRRHAR
jgi:MFS family permease